MNDPRPDTAQKLLGAALMVVGGLLAVLCAIGTLGVIGVAVISMFANSTNLPLILTGVFSGFLAVAIFGGLPIVLGILIFRWGRGLYRDRPGAPRDID